MRGNALRLCKDKCFAHRLHHRSDHEVATQLEGMRPPWLAGDDGDTAAGSLEQGTDSLYCQRVSANRYPQLALLRDERPAENRRSDKVLLVLLVRFPQQPGKSDADGGERYMHCVQF